MRPFGEAPHHAGIDIQARRAAILLTRRQQDLQPHANAEIGLAGRNRRLHQVGHAVPRQPANGISRRPHAGQNHRRSALHRRRVLRHHIVLRIQRHRPADTAQVPGTVVNNRNHGKANVNYRGISSYRY